VSKTTLDLITFGETMIRLTSADAQPLERATSLTVTIGGAESNVCVALARLGRNVAWLSALPSNALGRRISGELRSHGVDVDSILWSDAGRAGVYFMETGSRPRPIRVTYDRADSVVAGIDPDAIDYTLVAGARALHLTGITPALSPACAEVCRRLVIAAAAADVPVVLDVNYRSLLWSPEQARLGLAYFCEHADVLLCGAGDARTIWNLDGSPEDVGRELLSLSGADIAVVTLGELGVCAVSREGEICRQSAVPVEIIDPVGAGDAFAAGFLNVWLDDRQDVSGALRSATALAALAMTIPGDLAIVTPDDLAATLALVDGSGDDIVR
jgi:2-dehydro-3-deoxygluconokinase